MATKQDKPATASATTTALPTVGGSYLADAAGAIERLAGTTETPPGAPRPRRGFGEPDAGVTPTPTEPPKE